MTSVDLLGEWRNELGSIMVFEKCDGGVLEGFFESAVGEVDPNRRFRLLGLHRGQVMAFCVDWEERQCVTSWTGRYSVENGVDTIHTVWHLARMYRDEELTEEAPVWAAFLANADKFCRVGGRDKKA